MDPPAGSFSAVELAGLNTFTQRHSRLLLPSPIAARENRALSFLPMFYTESDQFQRVSTGLPVALDESLEVSALSGSD